MIDGYTDDKHVVLFSDLRKGLKLEGHYNRITDGFTVEGKGKSHHVIPKKEASKILINTNYTSTPSRFQIVFVSISSLSVSTTGSLGTAMCRSLMSMEVGFLRSTGPNSTGLPSM